MNHLKVEERKKIPAKCPICDKEFKNIYAMSSHKGHCIGNSKPPTHTGWSKGKNFLTDKRIKSSKTEETIFCEDSLVDRQFVKNILTAEGRGKSCEKCKITEWNGEEISFHLDHINGKNKDHRRENLQFLCPNCHSQTKTYCGKRNKGTKRSNQKKVTDEKFVEALRISPNINSALKKIDYPPCKAHYARAKELIEKFNIEMQ